MATKITVTGDIEATAVRGGEGQDFATQSSAPRTPAAGRFFSWFRVVGGKSRFIITNSAGQDTDITEIVNDDTPQLGGDLDVNGFTILSASNNDIVIIPDGTGSIRLGSNISTDNDNGTYLASGNISTDGDAQSSLHVLRNQTTDATQTELFIDQSSARLVLPDDTTWAFDVVVVARRTDANDEGARYTFQGAIDRNSGVGTTALIGSVTKTEIEDTAAWDADVDADTTNGSLRIRVTGEASKTINWVAFAQIISTTG